MTLGSAVRGLGEMHDPGPAPGQVTMGHLKPLVLSLGSPAPLPQEWLRLILWVRL